MRKRIFFIASLFFLALTLYSLHLPFFWDGTFFSEAAVYFFDRSGHFIPPLSCDTGGLPLYPLYLAAGWKILGKSLEASHLLMLPVLLMISWEYLKLASRYLQDKMLPAALLLFLCEPTFITQGILMGADMFLVMFLLMSLNSLLAKQDLRFSISLLLLSSCSMRGIILGITIFFIDLFLNRRISFKIFRNYFPALAAVILWAIYHHAKTGWYFFSPEREHTDESFSGAGILFHKLLNIAWQVADFGRIFLLLFLIMVLPKLYVPFRKQKLQELLALFFIPLLGFSFFILPLNISIAHKYFIPAFLVLCIFVCYLLQELQRRRTKLFILFFLCAGLISGNFWKYPERFGNGWDASLKVIPYFELKDSMDQYVHTLNIPCSKIGTQFPLIADKKYSELADSSYAYPNVWAGPLKDWPFVIQSNVINTDIPEQFEEVKQNWELLKRFKKGEAEIALYRNPGDH